MHIKFFLLSKQVLTGFCRICGHVTEKSEAEILIDLLLPLLSNKLKVRACDLFGSTCYFLILEGV